MGNGSLVVTDVSNSTLAFKALHCRPAFKFRHALAFMARAWKDCTCSGARPCLWCTFSHRAILIWAKSPKGFQASVRAVLGLGPLPDRWATYFSLRMHAVRRPMVAMPCLALSAIFSPFRLRHLPRRPAMVHRSLVRLRRNKCSSVETTTAR
jgi:hypothetical protein